MSVIVRWAVRPSISFRLLLPPVVLWATWELIQPFVHGYLNSSVNYPQVPFLNCSRNPFAGIFLLSGHIPESPSHDPRYRKSWWDIPFLVYYLVFFSFLRQFSLKYVFLPMARYFGLRRRSKIERFGEQAYAMVYHTTVGLWGYHIMSTLPIHFYNTAEFWKGYPHWDMKPQLKRYYLMQFSYWMQQLLFLLGGVEKPRSDHLEFLCHHFVTLWLVGWSYFLNFTYIGVAVFISMDLPDGFFSFSKLLNYIQYNKAKIYSFLTFFCVWTYFRHYISLKILWSVWFELPEFIPDSAKRWSAPDGVYVPEWMRYHVFMPLLLLQFLNIFWYSLIVKVLIRAVTTAEADDERSDHED